MWDRDGQNEARKEQTAHSMAREEKQEWMETAIRRELG